MLALYYWTTLHNFNIYCHNSNTALNAMRICSTIRNCRRIIRDISFLGYILPVLSLVLSTTLSGIPLFCSILCPRSIFFLQLITPAEWMQSMDRLLKSMECQHLPALLRHSAGALYLEHWESVKHLKGEDLFLSFQLLSRIPVPSFLLYTHVHGGTCWQGNVILSQHPPRQKWIL